MRYQRESVEGIPVKPHTEDPSPDKDEADYRGQDAGPVDNEDKLEVKISVAAQKKIRNNQKRYGKDEEVGNVGRLHA
jgi:hypothetical protein